jgi:hypothetical protein
MTRGLPPYFPIPSHYITLQQLGLVEPRKKGERERDVSVQLVPHIYVYHVLYSPSLKDGLHVLLLLFPKPLDRRLGRSGMGGCCWRIRYSMG